MKNVAQTIGIAVTTASCREAVHSKTRKAKSGDVNPKFRTLKAHVFVGHTAAKRPVTDGRCRDATRQGSCANLDRLAGTSLAAGA